MGPSKITRGVHRFSMDLDMDLWDVVLATSEATGEKPVKVVRRWIAERGEAERRRAEKKAG